MGTNMIFRNAIRNCWTNLLKDLDPLAVLDLLYQEKVIDEDDKQRIEAHVTTRDKSAILMRKIIENNDEKVFEKFVNYLESCQPHLAKLIENASSEKSSGNINFLVTYVP